MIAAKHVRLAGAAIGAAACLALPGQASAAETAAGDPVIAYAKCTVKAASGFAVSTVNQIAEDPGSYEPPELMGPFLPC